MAGPIRIAILANAAQAKRELNSTQREMNGFQRGVGKLGNIAKAGFAAAAVGAGVLGAKVVSFGKESVSAASDLEQSTGAVEAIFGKQAAGIKQAAEGAAQAFGLSKNSYQELASTLGAGLKNQGLTDYADKTKQVIGLGADLAAQFGGSTKDAVEAISSLMRGEADPIERYGVSIKQSAINAELAANGQNKLTGAARTQAEAQARLKLLFDQTKNAQGTFAKESDTLAGKQARNAAAWENLKAKMGTVFLPVAIKVQEVLANQVLPVVERLFGWISQNAPAAVKLVTGFMGGLKGDGTATKYLDYVKTAFATILPIVQSLVGAIVAAWPAISSALSSVFDALKSVMAVVGQLWGLFGPTIIAQVTNVFTIVSGIIAGAMNIIAGVFKTISAVMQGDWRGAWNGIQQIVSGAFGIIKAVVVGALTTLDNLTGGQLTKIKNLWLNTWNITKTNVSNTIESIRSTVSNKIDAVRSKIGSTLTSIKTTWSSAWTWLKEKLSSAWQGIVTTVKQKIDSVKEKITGLKTKITNVFSNAGSWLINAGKEIVRGLIKGIESMISSVKSKLSSLTNLIPDWKGPAERDRMLLYGAGRLIMQGLVRGLDSGEDGVRRQLEGVTALVQGGLNGVMTPKLTPSVSLPGGYGSAAGGGNVYQLEVKVDPTMDPAEVGREIVKSIEAYEAAGGRRRAA